MAKNTYQRQKDQKDQAKKRKKAEKLQRRHEKGAGDEDDGVAYDEFSPSGDPVADNRPEGEGDPSDEGNAKE